MLAGGNYQLIVINRVIFLIRKIVLICLNAKKSVKSDHRSLDIPGHNELMLTAFGTDISSRSPVARSSKILTEAARSPWGS